MQSTLKDADPHDIFAIEPSFAATRTDTAATLAPAAAGAGAAGQREPYFGPTPAPSPVPQVAPANPAPLAATVPPVAPTYGASSHEGKLHDIRLEREPRPTSRWAIRAFWFAFAIVSAMGAAAWQHYGHRVKQMVVEYVPQAKRWHRCFQARQRPLRSRRPRPQRKRRLPISPPTQRQPLPRSRSPRRHLPLPWRRQRRPRLTRRNCCSRWHATSPPWDSRSSS